MVPFSVPSTLYFGQSQNKLWSAIDNILSVLLNFACGSYSSPDESSSCSNAGSCSGCYTFTRAPITEGEGGLEFSVVRKPHSPAHAGVQSLAETGICNNPWLALALALSELLALCIHDILELQHKERWPSYVQDFLPRGYILYLLKVSEQHPANVDEQR